MEWSLLLSLGGCLIREQEVKWTVRVLVGAYVGRYFFWKLLSDMQRNTIPSMQETIAGMNVQQKSR